MARMKLVGREHYRSQRDRFQNPARFAHLKRKEERKKKKIKIKKLLPQVKNVEVKKPGRIVIRMVVRCKSFFSN